MSSDDRLTDLEVRLAFQQRTIATLDEVVREFAARVERLERQLAEMVNRASSEEPPAGPGLERPPHY
jgi:SlyX protein